MVIGPMRGGEVLAVVHLELRLDATEQGGMPRLLEQSGDCFGNRTDGLKSRHSTPSDPWDITRRISGHRVRRVTTASTTHIHPEERRIRH